MQIFGQTFFLRAEARLFAWFRHYVFADFSAALQLL